MKKRTGRRGSRDQSPCDTTGNQHTSVHWFSLNYFKRQVAIFVGLLLASASPLSAHNGAHPPGTVMVGHGWNFTLPTLDGSRFVTASELSGPVLVTFLRRDCAHCLGELSRLETFTQAHPQWTLLLVAVEPPAQVLAFAQRHATSVTLLRAGANVDALMRAAGNRPGALPFTAALRNARLCDGQLGEPNAADLERIASRCVAERRQ